MLAGLISQVIQVTKNFGLGLIQLLLGNSGSSQRSDILFGDAQRKKRRPVN